MGDPMAPGTWHPLAAYGSSWQRLGVPDSAAAWLQQP